MLRDAQALKRLVIMYDVPTEHGSQLLFVRGDGSLIVQAYPGRPMAAVDLPTCRERVDQDRIRELVSLTINRQFWDLPERRFIFLGGVPSNTEFQIHSILVSDGDKKATRAFGVGTYAGKQETIPDDFALIEQQLKKLVELTVSHKPCHFAPAEKRP
jgi:hypothetical protein